MSRVGYRRLHGDVRDYGLETNRPTDPLLLFDFQTGESKQRVTD